MRRGGGIFSKVLYGPVHEVLGFAGNTVGTITNTAKGVAHTGLRGVNRLGRSVTHRADAAVGKLLSRRNRKNRRNSRKNRTN
jgi:hypothetical protein